MEYLAEYLEVIFGEPEVEADLEIPLVNLGGGGEKRKMTISILLVDKCELDLPPG